MEMGLFFTMAGLWEANDIQMLTLSIDCNHREGWQKGAENECWGRVCVFMILTKILNVIPTELGSIEVIEHTGLYWVRNTGTDANIMNSML